MAFQYQGYRVDVCEEFDLAGSKPTEWMATVQDGICTVYSTAAYPTRQMAEADAMAWIDGRVQASAAPSDQRGQ